MLTLSMDNHHQKLSNKRHCYETKRENGDFGIFVLLLFAAVVWAETVLDNGQMKCYNDTVEITCQSIGQPFYG